MPGTCDSAYLIDLAVDRAENDKRKLMANLTGAGRVWSDGAAAGFLTLG